jgi:hypothetical protein
MTTNCNRKEMQSRTRIIPLMAVWLVVCGIGPCSRAHSATAQTPLIEAHRSPNFQIFSSAKRPTTVTGLLKNLKLTWDKKLLLDPAFFAQDNLMRFFSGTKVSWKEPPAEPDNAWRVRVGTLTLGNESFPNVTVSLRQVHHVAKQLRKPGSIGYSPAFVQNAGQVEMDVQSLQGFTWGLVKYVFGSRAQHYRVDPIWDILPTPGSYTSDNKAGMRYLYDDDPAPLSTVDLSRAAFLLKQGPVSAKPDSYGHIEFGEPLDTDIVKSVIIYESATIYETVK